jgi:hypothetical protein
LYRSDIRLPEFRKELFKRPAEHLKGVRHAAVSSNFGLTNDEFASLLTLPEVARVEVLQDLVFAKHLRLCVLEAVRDGLDVSLSAWEDSYYAGESLRRKLETLTGHQWERELLLELRLYRYARRAVPIKPDTEGVSPSEELRFLRDVVRPGDTWGTFMAFDSEWRKQWASKKGLERLASAD